MSSIALDASAAGTAVQPQFVVPDDVVAKVQTLTPVVFSNEPDPRFTSYSRDFHTFTIASAPGFVFKTDSPGRMLFEPNGDEVGPEDFVPAWLKKMDIVRAACLEHGLDRIVIPRATIVNITLGNKCNYPVLAVESLGVNLDHSVQEELRHKYASQLDETVRQLAELICRTKCADVSPKHIPLIDVSESDATRRVWFADVEEFSSESPRIAGLVDCVSEQHFAIIQSQVARFRYMFRTEIVMSFEAPTVQFEQWSISRVITHKCERRKAEIERWEAISAFHTSNNIIRGDEQIVANAAALGLDPTETGEYKQTVVVGNAFRRRRKTLTMEAFVTIVVGHINAKIQNSPLRGVHARRNLRINTSRDELCDMKGIGLPIGQQDGIDADITKFWINRVLDKLIEHGHLFDRKGNTLIIQA